MSKQTLAVLAEPASPPTQAMSDAFVGEMAKLNNLGRSELKALAAVALTYAVNTAGDTDYRAAHPTLLRDALVFWGGVERLDDNGTSKPVILAQTVLAWQKAYDGDSSISTSVDALLILGRDFMALPEETLNRVLLFLQVRAERVRRRADGERRANSDDCRSGAGLWGVERAGHKAGDSVFDLRWPGQHHGANGD